MPPPGVQKEVPHHAAPEAKVPNFLVGKRGEVVKSLEVKCGGGGG